MHWKKLASQELFAAGVFKLRSDRCELPDGRIMPNYYVLEFPDWVNIVPLSDDNQIVLVEQYRHATGEIDPRKLADAVLVRLATSGPSPKVDVARDIAPLLGPALRGAGARALIDTAFAELQTARAISTEDGNSAATPAGRKRALERLGLRAVR